MTMEYQNVYGELLDELDVLLETLADVRHHFIDVRDMVEGSDKAPIRKAVNNLDDAYGKITDALGITAIVWRRSR